MTDCSTLHVYGNAENWTLLSLGINCKYWRHRQGEIQEIRLMKPIVTVLQNWFRYEEGWLEFGFYNTQKEIIVLEWLSYSMLLSIYTEASSLQADFADQIVDSKHEFGYHQFVSVDTWD
jgi:hypothetical protein